MKTTSSTAIFAFTLSLIATALVGCNSSGDVKGQDPIPEVKKLSANNYAEAAAVALVGYGRSQNVTNSIVNSGFQLIMGQKPAGTYPCKNGGNIQFSQAGAIYNFTPVDCDTGDIVAISGGFTLNFESGQAYKFNSVNYRESGDTVAQTFSGELKSSQANGISSTAGSFTNERNKKVDVYTNYKISAPAIGPGNPKVELTIASPRFAHTLTLNLEVIDSTVVGKIEADDGSQVTISLAKDDSAKIELKSSANGVVLASRTLTPAETRALVQKAME